MNLSEAIKQNQKHVKFHSTDPSNNYYKALKLGIEAMKREEYNRIHHLFPIIGPLPGETEE